MNAYKVFFVMLMSIVVIILKYEATATERRITIQAHIDRLEARLYDCGAENDSLRNSKDSMNFIKIK